MRIAIVVLSLTVADGYLTSSVPYTAIHKGFCSKLCHPARRRHDERPNIISATVRSRRLTTMAVRPLNSDDSRLREGREGLWSPLQRLKNLASNAGRRGALKALKKRLTSKFVSIALALCMLMPGILAPRPVAASATINSGGSVPTWSVRETERKTEKLGTSNIGGRLEGRSTSFAPSEPLAQSLKLGTRQRLMSSKGSAAVLAKGGTEVKGKKTPLQSSKKTKSTGLAQSAENQGGWIAKAVVENAMEIGSDFEHHVGGGKRDTLLLLMSIALVIPLCKKAGQSPILGFLATGTLLGPNGLGLITDVHATAALGELGIVFFLFEMGLELSLARLKAMKRDVFGLGLAQFFLTSVGVAAVANLAGLSSGSLVVIGGGLALSSSAFVLQLLKDRDDMGTRYGKACFGVLLLQDLAVVPLLVSIPLLAGTGGSMTKALGTAAAKTVLALSTIAFVGKTIMNRLFYLVARSQNQEAFLAVILLMVIGMSSLTEGLGLSNTLGAFLAGVLLSETNYRDQVEADIAPFRGILLGLFFMTVGFEIDLGLVMSNLPLVSSLVVGLLALKSAVMALICLGMGLSLANAQQTGLLLSQGGEFAFVAFGMAEKLGILSPSLTKLLLTTVAISMASTPMLSNFSAWVADRIESRMGFSHYTGGDSESKEIKQREAFVAVCGYGRVGRLVCDLLDRKFIPYVAFENDPRKAIEARNKGLPVFFGDVTRADVLKNFNVGKARAVISTISDIKTANKAVVTIRREFPDMPLFVRAKDPAHQKRLQGTLNVVAMVPTLPEDSILVCLPFGGAVLRSLGIAADEVNLLLEETRKRSIRGKGLEANEEESMLEQLGLGMKEEMKEKAEAARAPPSQNSTDEPLLVSV